MTRLEKVKICIQCRLWVPIYTDNDMAQTTEQVFSNIHHRHMTAIIPASELDRKVYNRFYYYNKPSERSEESGGFTRTPRVW